MNDHQIREMKLRLWQRWAKLHVDIMVGRVARTDESSARHRVAYGTYRQFCRRHGYDPAGYGRVIF